MQFIKDKERGPYGYLSNVFIAEKQMYKMAHEMHSRKYKSPIEENPQKEGLQPCIKADKGLKTLFYQAATFVDYTSDLEKISA